MTKKPHLHERRGLSFAEYGALLGVRELLASGQMAHTKRDSVAGSQHLFNMGVTCNANEGCGSVQCIGGAMALIMGMGDLDARRFVGGRRDQAGLGELFYPPTKYAFRLIEPQQAVQAIDNFRKYGKPRWETILRKNQIDT